MRPLIVTALACTLGWSTTAEAQDGPSFFVEIEPARSTFFTGDYITVHVISNRPELSNAVDVEILAVEQVVWSSRLVVAASRRVIRKGMPHFGISIVVRVDEKLPPGTYRARARQGDTISQPSATFTVEPWGAPDKGVQVALAAPASVASGGSLVVTLSLRNMSDHSLHVPSDGPRECATSWLTFVIFEGDVATGRGLRDDRKDCGRQPTVLLQPGKMTTQQVDLGRFNEHGHEPRHPFRPPPGHIRLHVSVRGGYYEADAGRPGLWKGKALSNKVSIEVR